MLDELHGWHVAFDAYGRGGLRPTHRNIIARSTRRLIKCAHIRRCHCDSKGMLISREVFLRTEGEEGGMSGIAAMIFLMIALFLYFIPAIIALDSKLLNSGSS